MRVQEEATAMSDDCVPQPILRARGQRLDFASLPIHVARTIDIALGDPIVSTTSIDHGFSPGVACIVRTFGGQEFFLKAACSVPSEHAGAFHRKEIAIASRLGPEVPTGRLIWSFDEGTPGWVVLVYKVVHGHSPELPWRSDDVDMVVDALNQLATTLTPSPIPEADIGSLTASGILGSGCWQRIHMRIAYPASFEPPVPFDPWTRRHLDRLIELEGRVGDVVAGDTLLHIDIRGDNMLITDDGVVIVDWPHAKVGAAWVDAVLFAPSLAMQGGPEPEDFIARIDVARAADPTAVTVCLAGLAGFHTYNSSLPPLEALPGLREFQAGQGAVARRWLAQRTGWT